MILSLVDDDDCCCAVDEVAAGPEQLPVVVIEADPPADAAAVELNETEVVAPECNGVLWV